MAEVVLNVSPQEMADLEQDKWYRGMVCPVQECTEAFNVYADMREHWSLVHEPIINYFKCQKCSFRIPRRNQMKRHYDKRHGIPPEVSKPLIANGSSERNSKYVDPQSVCMPVDPVTTVKARKREEAAAQRRADAARIDTSSLTSRREIVARDQEVVPLGRGRGIIRDQLRWLRGTARAAAAAFYDPIDVDFNQFPEN